MYSIINHRDSKKLWDSLQRNDKNDLGDTDHSVISLADPNEVNRRKTKEARDPDTTQVDSSSVDKCLLLHFIALT